MIFNKILHSNYITFVAIAVNPKIMINFAIYNALAQTKAQCR